MSTPRYSKRKTPDGAILAARTTFLRSLASLDIPLLGPDSQPFLERGNSKLGQRGRLAETVFVWNLPAIVTCPGASPWCSSHCYNADARQEKFPVGKWAANWAWVVERSTELRAFITSQINSAPRPVAIRIHSSGDFFSSEYVDVWSAICSECPEASFWAYTRSWANGSIISSLENLRSLPNVEMFASWDITMAEPPAGWRLSVVVEDSALDGNADRAAIRCPEEEGRVPNCADCGYCFTRRPGDVLFALH